MRNFTDLELKFCVVVAESVTTCAQSANRSGKVSFSGLNPNGHSSMYSHYKIISADSSGLKGDGHPFKEC